MKFKKGDTIVHVSDFKQTHKATIYQIKDKKYYLRIMNGIQIIPIKAEVAYEKLIKKN